MLGRRIHSIQDQWCGASVDKLMLRACWHDDKVSSFDVLIFSCDGGFAYAGSEGQDLINGVFLTRSVNGFVSGAEDRYFIADVSANWDGHQDQLGIETCE